LEKIGELNKNIDEIDLVKCDKISSKTIISILKNKKNNITTISAKRCGILQTDIVNAATIEFNAKKNNTKQVKFNGEGNGEGADTCCIM
jgi:hypothetical protein